MAKLDDAEKEIVACALLAMIAECPPEEQEGFGMMFVSIVTKLGLKTALAVVNERARAARSVAPVGKVG